jgi:hypothetical protein
VFGRAQLQVLDDEPIDFFERIGIKQSKNATKGIVRRDACFEREKLFEPFELGIAEGLEVVVGFGAADDGNEGNEQDFVEGIGGLPDSGIINFINGFGESVGDFLDFSVSVVFFDRVDNLFWERGAFRGSSIFHKSSVIEKRILTIAHTGNNRTSEN